VPEVTPSSSRAQAEAADKALRLAMAETAEQQRLRDRKRALAGIQIDPAHEASVIAGLAERGALEDANRASALPRLDDRDTPEEATLIFTADPSAADAQIPGVEVRQRGERPTVYGAILGRSFLVPPRAPVEGPTLVSARFIPKDDAPDPIEERYLALCEAARVAGLTVDHCANAAADCHESDDAAGACLCTCDGCTRNTSYLAQAEREILGPPQADTPRPGRE
jgi:hypothetical protein